MRRMWAKWRRLNRASRSASERLRLCGPELSVLPFTTSPPGKKLRGATSYPNPEPPLSGRCSPNARGGEGGASLWKCRGRIPSRHSLLEKQGMLQEALHVGGAEDLLLESLRHRPPQNFRTVALQDLVQAIHFAQPLPRPAMHNLGQIAQSRLAQIQ